MERAIKLSTPHGDVEATEFGTAVPGNFVLCVQGKSPNLDVVTEWQPVARALAAAGWHVILPNLHSNESTKPGACGADDVAKVLLAAFSQFNISQPALLCGKSWGGGQATRFAAAHPALISRLILVAPSLDEPSATTRLASENLPVQLFWSRDDSVVPIARAEPYTTVLAPTLLSFVTVEAGGHRILDEYIAPILQFCGAAGDADAVSQERASRGDFSVSAQPVPVQQHLMADAQHPPASDLLAGMSIGTVSAPLRLSGLEYMVFLPSGWARDRGKRPVCLFLHGAGGVNNVENIRRISLVSMLLRPEYAAQVEHVVLIPVAPTSGWQGHFAAVLSLVDMAVAELGGDPSRVALAGQSMGGYGAWTLATEYPHRFCAIVPMCAYARSPSAWRVALSVLSLGLIGSGVDAVPQALVERLANKPIWVFHSEDDWVVSVRASDAVVKALKDAGSTDVKYTRYPSGVTPGRAPMLGHACYELAFAEEGLWPWLGAAGK